MSLNKNLIYKNAGEKIAQKATKSQVRTKYLQRQLKKTVQELKRLYIKTLFKSKTITQLTSNEQWLCDNFYIISSEAMQIIKELKAAKFMPVSNDKKITVFNYAVNMCKLSDNLLTTEIITEFISGSETICPMSSKELFLLSSFIKCALVLNIYKLFKIEGDKAYSNIYNTLRFLNSFDFSELIFSISKTEKVLSKDPAGIYSEMDAKSKGHYRHLIYNISKKKKISEYEVAQNALNIAKKNKEHIGEYIREKKGKDSKLVYFSLLVAMPLIINFLVCIIFDTGITGALFFIPIYAINKALVDFTFSKIIKPRFLPRLEFENELPPSAATLTVISTLLISKESIKGYIDKLEEYYLKNKLKGAYFGLLCDFKDNKNKSVDLDANIAEEAVNQISKLNEKYGDIFFLFIRERVFSKTENKYIGWERKRGAITELVRKIKNDKNSFKYFCGDFDSLTKVKYILTLDSDTNMPFNTISELVGVAEHPINMEYALFQPTIGIDLISSNKTLFSKIMAGHGGVDIYSTLSSDILFDMLGEGAFCGKGLFRVDKYYEKLNDSIPEEKILSHDLIEGAILKTGLVTDVKLYDGFPSGVISYFQRHRRWTRGDIQSLIFYGKINGLLNYRLFENVRRTITPLISLAALIYCQYINVKIAVISAIIYILYSLTPLTANAVINIFKHGSSLFSQKYYSTVLNGTKANVLRIIYLIGAPFYESVINLIDVIKTLVRMNITKKHMLSWVTAQESDLLSKDSLLYAIKKLWISILLGLITIFIGANLFVKLLGIFAVLFPFYAYILSINQKKKSDLSDKQKEIIKENAQSIWGYFRDFMNEENNYLPPDNFQEIPLGVVAHRTSPTNIGMGLLSIVTARDFDFIDNKTMISMLTNTINTIEKMLKHQGHLYNWYDTKTLDLLRPAYVSTVDSANLIASLIALKYSIKDVDEELYDRVEMLLSKMDLSYFYNSKRNLFYIGYDIESETFTGCYDLYMSEARIASYIAIAYGLIPKKHWSNLSRIMTGDKGYIGICSWTGTMFEYFMPHIFLPNYENSLCNETLLFAINAHKGRVAKSKIPYGISESGFFSFDNSLAYQYKAFGVSKLGLKSGLDNELVISPYSTFLTMQLDLNSALDNLEKLTKYEMNSKYGYYEALDFSSDKDGEKIIKSYMAHHCGMSLLMCANTYFDGIFQKRFMSDPKLSSARELLQERLPIKPVLFKNIGVENDSEREKLRSNFNNSIESSGYNLNDIKGYLLSNGKTTHFNTDIGIGYTKYEDKFFGRFTGDLFDNTKSQYVFAKFGNDFFSVSPAPNYDNSIIYSCKYNDSVITHEAISKSGTLKRSVTLHDTLPCKITEVEVKSKEKNKEIAIYFEPTLTTRDQDEAHPAFSNLFIESDFDKENKILYIKRRPRSDSEENTMIGMKLIADNVEMHFETRRDKMFCRDICNKYLCLFSNNYMNDTGACIDPCVAAKIKINSPKESVKIYLFSAMGNSEEEVKQILEKAVEKGFSKCSSQLAQTIQIQRNAAKAKADTMALLCNILPSFYFDTPNRINVFDAVINNNCGTSGLWRYGISGDLPIICVTATDINDADRLSPFISVHKFLYLSNIKTDLIILVNDNGEYDRPLYNMVLDVASSIGSGFLVGVPGGINIVNTKKDSVDENLFKTFSSYYVNLSNPMNNSYEELDNVYSLCSKNISDRDTEIIYGDRFVQINKGNEKRSPYFHIIANRTFGNVLSENGLGYSFAFNAREYKLSKWTNDRLFENGEFLLLEYDNKVINLCCEASTVIFSEGSAKYIYDCNDFKATATIDLPDRGTFKIIEVSIEAKIDYNKNIKIAFCTEPVLGVSKHKSKNFLRSLSGDVFCYQNPNAGSFSHRFSFLWCNEKHNVNTERTHIFDTNGNGTLPSKFPFISLVTEQNISKKTKTVIAFGNCASNSELGFYIESIKNNNLNLREIKYLSKISSHVKINTPDKTLNNLMNALLPYQGMASRILGKTGFYQCGGAFGYRDQLQDMCSFAAYEPDFLRWHIYRCCFHQFEEGDVQHWWHNINSEKGKGHPGVRTKCSDDMLWLPYAVCDYIEKTGYYKILDKKIRYIKGDLLQEGEDEKYFIPYLSDIKESVYEHCKKAILRSFKFGEHGLPLFGSGDWNDGMNKTGNDNSGESVFLAFFMALTLKKFADICDIAEDTEFKEKILEVRENILQAANNNAWDKDWFLRGYYVDGSALGKAGNDECEVDAISQSFSVLAENYDTEKSKKGLEAIYNILYDKEYSLIKLLTPPFQNGRNNTGYIKGYVAGTRENGGQYTHAAIWSAMSFFEIGDPDRGYELLSALNPVKRFENPKLKKVYDIEPYVIAADIYTNKSQYGRGGWSWYTGSAGWYMTAVYENLLGIYFKNKLLYPNPCLPSHFDTCSAEILVEDKRVLYVISRRDEKGIYADGVKVSDGIDLKKVNKIEVFI